MQLQDEAQAIDWCRKAALVFLVAGLSGATAIALAFAQGSTNHLTPGNFISDSPAAKPAPFILPKLVSPKPRRTSTPPPPDFEWAINNPPLAFLESLAYGDLEDPKRATYVPIDWVTGMDAAYLLNLVGDETPCREVIGTSTSVYRGTSTIGFEAQRMLMSFSQLGRRYPYCRPNADAKSHEIITAALRAQLDLDEAAKEDP
ncbi:MAG: hypothetical protein AAF497_05850 [Planctomycetota bacterium]